MQDRQTTKYRATQLVLSLTFKLSHATNLTKVSQTYACKTYFRIKMTIPQINPFGAGTRVSHIRLKV